MNTSCTLREIDYHHHLHGFSDRVAYCLVRFARFFADTFFVHRYGHRAVVLETIAAVPGMVGGMLEHFRSLRRIRNDHGAIKTLLDEAENERMHLMVYIHITRPTRFERFIILLAQIVFSTSYFIMYCISSKTAHRMVGYLEEEAIKSYSAYLKDLEEHPHKNVAAPDIAIAYWKLAPDARLIDVVLATRKDEMMHRDVNHGFADRLR